MAAPTNQTALTAIELGTLPASVVQDVHDAGTTYTVWYKVTALATDKVVSVWGSGNLASFYAPTGVMYIGPAGAPVLYLGGFSAINKPYQSPVDSTVEYFFQFVTNGGNPNPAILSINVSNLSI